jgi:hypothetical protein
MIDTQESELCDLGPMVALGTQAYMTSRYKESHKHTHTYQKVTGVSIRFLFSKRQSLHFSKIVELN